MPTLKQRHIIETRRLGLRVVAPGREAISGSCYHLFDFSGDWERNLKRTAEICAGCAGADVRIYLLSGVPDVRSGQFGTGTQRSLGYGRLLSTMVANTRVVAHAGLYPRTAPEHIVSWVMGQIDRSPAVDRRGGQPADGPEPTAPTYRARLAPHLRPAPPAPSRRAPAPPAPSYPAPLAPHRRPIPPAPHGRPPAPPLLRPRSRTVSDQLTRLSTIADIESKSSSRRSSIVRTSDLDFT